MMVLQDFGPSQRALAAADEGPAWEMMQSFKSIPRYDPRSCLDGLIDLSGADNGLMDDWKAHFIANRPDLQMKQQWLSYGAIAGSPALRRAAAGLFNRHFDANPRVTADDIIAANGVTSLIDLMAWTLCDPGDAVLYPTPNFYMLDCDLKTRGAVRTVPFSTSALSPDPFDEGAAQAMVDLAEVAARDFERCSSRGRCKVLFLCNPANPQGRGWPPATLRALAFWCARRGMHLVVDEIYAMSDFATGQPTSPAPFKSCLSLIGDGVLRQNVHCLYGMSKDYGMGGLRVGFMVTQNQAVRTAAMEATWFTWLTAYSDAFVTGFLSDLDAVDNYLSVYRRRLSQEYDKTVRTLIRNQIPFSPASAGLFVYINLSQWLHYFDSHQAEDAVAQRRQHHTLRPELQLNKWLVHHGVLLNPGEFAGSDQPGHFRMVFTEFPGASGKAVERIRDALDRLERLQTPSVSRS